MAKRESNSAVLDELETGAEAPSAGRREPVAVVEDRVAVELILGDRNHRRPRPGDAAKFEKLKQSIAEHGLMQAIGVAKLVPGMAGYDVRGEGYRLLFGARRLLAMIELGAAEVPVRVFAVSSDAEVESMRAVENLHRQDISAIEEAQAVSDVIGFYLQEDPLASRADAIRFCAEHTGQTEEWVRARDYFERLTPKVRAAALEADVPATHLRELAVVGSEADQWALLLQVLGVAQWRGEELKSIDPAACKDVWAREQLEELREAVDAGAVRYMPIRELRKAVGESQRKLRSVKWDLSLVVLSGKEELRPCVGCPKNSATEPGLFGLDESPAVKDATCGDAACFKAKGEAAEKARAALLKSFEKKQAVPSAEEVKAKLDGKAVWAGGLDVKKAVGFVQREVKKRVAPGSDSEGKKSGGSGGGASYGGRKLTQHEVALQKYGRAHSKWESEVAGVLEEAIAKDRVRRVMLIVMRSLGCLNWKLTVRVPAVYDWSSEEKGKPSIPGPLKGDALKALELFKLGTVEALLDLAAMELDGHGQNLSTWMHVEIAEGMGQVLGIAVAPMPVWSDFDPAAKVKAKEAAPAEAGRPGVKKKVGKKKAAAKKKGPARRRVKQGEGVAA